jgi:hypothetical protein
MCILRNAFAYCVVSMLSAAFDEKYAGTTSVEKTDSGSAVLAIEPRPLDTLTTTGAADRSSMGKKACRTRTGPNTFMS